MRRTQSGSDFGLRVWMAFIAVAFLGAGLVPPAQAADTLARVRQAGKLVLGYRTDAQPFSYRDESGNAAGYSVELCKRIAAGVKDRARCLYAVGGVGAGRGRGTFSRPAAGAGGPAVRSGQRDAHAQSSRRPSRYRSSRAGSASCSAPTLPTGCGRSSTGARLQARGCCGVPRPRRS
jgi:ABC-type amino acid transport substrate-binding protein